LLDLGPVAETVEHDVHTGFRDTEANGRALDDGVLGS